MCLKQYYFLTEFESMFSFFLVCRLEHGTEEIPVVLITNHEQYGNIFSTYAREGFSMLRIYQEGFVSMK